MVPATVRFCNMGEAIVNDDNSMNKLVLMLVFCVGAFFFFQKPQDKNELPTDPDFIRQVTNAKPVIVKFGAEWCPPCQQVEEELNQLTQAFSDRVHVVKIDIDARPDLAKHFGIGSIPHIMLFQYGEQVKEFRGSRSADEIAEWAGLK